MREHLGLSSDLYELGRGECGELICGEVFILQLTKSNGERLVAPGSWNVTKRCYDDDGFLHVAPVAGAMQAANAALREAEARLRAGTLDTSNWERGYPVYGSEAWGAEDEYELAMLDYEY